MIDTQIHVRTMGSGRAFDRSSDPTGPGMLRLPSRKFADYLYISYVGPKLRSKIGWRLVRVAMELCLGNSYTSRKIFVPFRSAKARGFEPHSRQKIFLLPVWCYRSVNQLLDHCSALRRSALTSRDTLEIDIIPADGRS